MSDSNTSAVRLPRTVLLGVGSMGGAILEGLRAPEVRIDGPITVTTRSAASAAAFDGAEDVRALASETEPEANRIAVRGASIVILAVKPWMIHDVLREIAGDLEPGAIVVSVAAGTTIASMEALVPAVNPVVRAMPNTPSVIGKGVTGIAGGAVADAEVMDTVRAVFETVGRVLVVDEEQINAVAAVSGSGPAYLFLFVEEFVAAAKRLGFDDDAAKLLAEGTVAGAAALLESSGEDPAELRRRVTSPKGTTEQAVLVLQSGGWADLLDRALAANVRRSEELAAG
ncbi:pyrroline-5-carboxylate reductase [Leucobacter sp. HNU]|uniref:pyrroline-5-carboxylate reductase n=1 Tax=Leucobacter sp. HNU TaxID=3236805 RepID=UPI003A811D62